jgi:small subunit ribosomal protein S20
LAWCRTIILLLTSADPACKDPNFYRHDHFLHIQRERSHPLANHKSALKRAGQNENRRLRNRSVKSRVKTVVKQVRQAVASEAGDSIANDLKAAQATIDKAVKKGVLHKRTGARKIARLARLTQKA